MEKIVFFVFDKEATGDGLVNLESIKKTLGNNCHLLEVNPNNPQQILENVLKVIRVYGASHYSKMIVLYTGGEGFHLLKSNLPCDNVDINLLQNKLTEVVGGNDTPQNKYLICSMYAGAISKLIY